MTHLTQWLMMRHGISKESAEAIAPWLVSANTPKKNPRSKHVLSYQKLKRMFTHIVGNQLAITIAYERHHPEVLAMAKAINAAKENAIAS